MAYDPKEMQHDGAPYAPEGAERHTRQAVLLFIDTVGDIANHKATIETDDDLNVFWRFTAEGWGFAPDVPVVPDRFTTPERPDRGWFE